MKILKVLNSHFKDVYEVHPEQLQLGFVKSKGSYMEKQKRTMGLFIKIHRLMGSPFIQNGCLDEDVLVLKKVEEMVEVYYNSSQFSNTLRLLEKNLDTAFALYDTLCQIL